ncbi:spore coat U domain-containing protein [Burkholderia anthina]|uniref:Csu type fimbrial protein n=1 Tax=Burkholderia anthina TaxID=179879 RepID=UPI001CF48670|nr:spore coat U domain-containing protein [Burkholderia anthina]MCA8089370.1 spore coat U domain-containing protein [Burkholderia anthina]
MESLYTLLRRIVLTAALGLLAPLQAHADCAAASPLPAAFGPVTSFDVRNQAQSTSSSNSGVTCGGALAAFLVIGNHIYGTISSATGGKMVGPTGDTIPYTLYADKNYTTQLNPGTQYDWASTQFLSFLGLGGGSSAPLPLYLRTTIGSNVAAGTYTDMLTINWSWHVCSGIGVIVCLGWSNGSTIVTVPVTLTVSNDCMINAPNVSFGAAPTVASFAPVNGSLSLTCTKGMVYTVGLSPGNNAAANGRRQMASGANRLQYDLYSAGGSTVWGQATNRVSSPGAADGQSVQAFPYVARIYTDQPTPPVGTYTDSVIVDVRY